MTRILLTLALTLALTLPVGAAHHEEDEDEYSYDAKHVIRDADHWYTIRYPVVTLPTDEGKCSAYFYFSTADVPGGPDGFAAPVVYPVNGSLEHDWTAFANNFHAVPYGPKGIVGFGMMIRIEGPDCAATPIAYRVKARVRGKQ